MSTLNLARIAENLLTQLSRDEVAKLVQVLDYYNSGCVEDSRARCLRNGCKTNQDPELEPDDKPVYLPLLQECKDALDTKKRKAIGCSCPDFASASHAAAESWSGLSVRISTFCLLARRSHQRC
jgi:hypothetical protein